MNKYNLIQSMTFLLALVVLPGSQFVNATPIDPNISISGGTSFDMGFSVGDTTGGMTNTVGGASTTTEVAGSAVTNGGANPLNGTLRDTGDGYSIYGSGNASANGEEFAMGFDNTFTVTNNSLTSTYDVVLKLVYSNWVDSSGDDAYADSIFTVEQNGDENFFSYVVSDTVNGNVNENEKGDSPTGSSGGPVSDSRTELISITLTALESMDFDLIWTLEGGNFADGGAAAFDSSFDLSVESVTDPSAVPIPGAVVLFGTGLFGLLGLTRKRKTIII